MNLSAADAAARDSTATALRAPVGGTVGITSGRDLRRMQIALPEPLILLNPWQRMHWAARRKYLCRLAWLIQSAAHPPAKPMEQCVIRIKRYSTAVPDWDGLYGGLKPLLDCLVVATDRNPHGLGFIRDDNPAVIVDLNAEPIRIRKRAEARTEVFLQEVIANHGR